MSGLKRGAALALAVLLGGAHAVGIKLRPQGAEMTRAVQQVLAALGTPESPVTLDTSGGPLLFLGGSGANAAPFNPDVAARTLNVGGERRIEFNPQGPLPLEAALRAELTRELGLKEWTPTAARTRLSGADLNADGVIDLTDLALLMNNYGKPGSTVGDLNQDRKVDDVDLRLFGAQYKP